MSWASVRAAGLAAAAAWGVFCAGCEAERPADERRVTDATLEGTITYKGEKVPYALVIVEGDNMSATGKVDKDGRYRVEQVPLGEVTVSVNTDAGRGDYMSASMASSYRGPDGKGAKKPAPKFVEVPKKYHEPGTTPLRTTTKGGENTYDIVIK